MRNKKRMIATALACTMAASTLVACGGNKASNDSQNSGDGTTTTQLTSNAAEYAEDQIATEPVDTITVALTASSFDTSPFGEGSIPRFWFVQNLYASLMCMPKYGATFDELQPWLAKSVEKVDDATYSVELYDYIKDSKGNDITSEDIVFSYENMAEARIASYLDNIEVVDDYNMIFHLKKSGPGIIEFLLANYTLGVCDKGWYEAASAEERVSNPATTGAYEIESYTAGSDLILKAVDGYWQEDTSLRCEGDTVNVNRIDYKVITENSMRSVALENHEIDASVIDATELMRFFDGTNALEGWNVDIEPGTFTYSMFVNMDENSTSPLAKDINLRMAALYALDSESILYGGNYDETTGTVVKTLGTPIMNGYEAAASDDYFIYDPEVAKQYYEASGNAEGAVEVRILSRTSIADGTHSVIVSNLEAAGFKVNLMTYDQALFNTYKSDSSQWDLMLDNKGATGYVFSGWDNMFNPASYANGSCCFTHDDKLAELLANVTSTGADEDIVAFHDYLKEIACVKGLYTINNLMVGQDGILELTVNANAMPRINTFVFSKDYQSVAK